MAGLAEAFDQVRAEVDDLIDAGDSVVALGGFRGRGALSGATAPQQWGAVVFQLRDRRIVSYRAYFRRDEALEAVGISE
jgi:ketosteroid isomerase-like protein